MVFQHRPRSAAGIPYITLGLLWGLALPPAAVEAQHGGHAFHPPMPNQQFVLRCQTQDKVVETPIKLASPGMPSELSQTVELPAPFAPVRVSQYLPRAVLDQSVVAAEGPDTHHAIKLSIEGPTQSHQRWLLAGDADRNRITSYIGTWRYMAVDGKPQRDELLRQFEEEYTRPPKLFISDAATDSPWHEIAAKPGTGREISELGCHVRILEFFSHFGIDQATKKPVNQSERRINPALLVEIRKGERTEQRWVFSAFPDFSMPDADSLPFRTRFDCPKDARQRRPDFVLVTIAAATHEVWQRYEGHQTVRTIGLKDKVDIPGSQYSFAITAFVPSGRLIESFSPATDKGGVAALKLETLFDSTEGGTLWLGMGRERTIRTVNGAVTLVFGVRRPNTEEVHP